MQEECLDTQCVQHRSDPSHLPLDRATNTIRWVPPDLQEALGPYLLWDLICIVQSYIDPVDRIQQHPFRRAPVGQRWTATLKTPITMLWTGVDIPKRDPMFEGASFIHIRNRPEVSSQIHALEDLLCRYMHQHGVQLWGSAPTLKDVRNFLEPTVFGKRGLIECHQRSTHLEFNQDNCRVDMDVKIDHVWVCLGHGTTHTWGFHVATLCVRNQRPTPEAQNLYEVCYDDPSIAFLLY